MHGRRGRTTHLRQRQRGFSLFELTLIVLVTGIVVSSIIVTEPAKKEREAREVTVERLSVIKQAIQDYKARNGYYPCVSSRTALRGTAGFGRVALANCVTDTSTPAGTLRTASGSDFVRIGAVPTRDLLLLDEYMSDGFGNRFTYAVTEKMTSSASYSGADGVVIVKDAADADITTEAAFLVFSHGRDGKGAYRYLKGTEQTTCGASTNLDVENCDGDNTFRSAEMTDSAQAAASFYDDMLGYGEATTSTPREVETTYLSAAFYPKYDFYMSCVMGDFDGADDGNSRADLGGYNLGDLKIVEGEASPPSMYVFNTEMDASLTGMAYQYYAVGNVNNDAYDDLIIGWSAFNSGRGQVLVYFGGAGGAFGGAGSRAYTVPVDITISSATVVGFGKTVAAGDVNGDGIDDIVVGVFDHVNAGGNGWGGLAIYFGRDTGSWSATFNYITGADVLIESGATGADADIAGGRIAIGDVNGDGIGDIISTGYNYQSPLRVIFGKSSGWSAKAYVSTYMDGTIGAKITDAAGQPHAVVDLNNDAYDDIVVANGNVIYGRATWPASQTTNTAQSTYTGGFDITDLPASAYKYSIWAGNLNGDSYGDFVLSAGNSGGVAYFFLGQSSWGSSFSVNSPDGNALMQVNGMQSSSLWGSTTANYDLTTCGGDFNGDGFDDVTIGVGQESASSKEHAWIIYGQSTPFPATKDLYPLF